MPVVSEVRDELGRGAMGEGQEHGVDLGQIGADGQLGRGEVRVVVTDRLVLAVAAGQPDDLDVRMARSAAGSARRRRSRSRR